MHKLLLADDSVTIQRVIELTFADEDVQVISVGDGQLAIDRLDADPPDIVLADVEMPKRDGYEVATYVKSRPGLAHIPVVLLTGAFEPIDHARARAAGSSDVLAKPFEPQMVINKVRQLLGRRQVEDGEPVAAPRAMQAQEPQMGAAVAVQPPRASVPPPPALSAPDAVSLDDYFDKLDAAFSNSQPAAAPRMTDTSQAERDWAESVMRARTEPAPQTPPASAAKLDEMWPEELVADQSAAVHHAAPATAPVGEASSLELAQALAEVALPPVPDVAAPPMGDPEPVVEPQPPAPDPVDAAGPSPLDLHPPAAKKPTTNPFAELSAAKAEATARPAAPVITDELIEQIVARVLERMTDRVVRETVTEIVSQTAERLVQDEIQRIKNETP